ncbi:MAG: hypothetical protein HYS32_03425 [Candidatus Woesearchaeota archaeon]|nr:MAG: hypothetical protein HYS32_03425 [Candidatus Woesearchaeota archaeon]
MATTFLEVVGDAPIFRVLDFLTVNEDFDYSMTDIAKFSEIGYSTLKLFWPTLEKENIVVIVRTVGKAKMYRLNDKNLVVKKFKEFYWTLTKNRIHIEKVKKSGFGISKGLASFAKKDKFKG